MVEALGLAMSVTCLIQLTANLISASYGYITAVKRAPKEIQDLVDELRSLNKILAAVQEYADTNPTETALQQINDQNDGPLKGCAQELKRLQLKLRPGAGPGLMKSLKWPLKEGETMKHISRIERLKSLFVLVMAVDNGKRSKAIEEHVSNTDLVVNKIQNEQLAERRNRVLNWLCPGDYNKRHLEISNRRQQDTGMWLLRRPEFKGWAKEDPDSRILWGYGIPGAGKTFLSSLVIDHLQAQVESGIYGVAYIYFDYNEKSQQTATHVLASLTKQLASQMSYIPTEIEKIYSQLEPNRKAPTLKQLSDTLVGVSKLFDRVFFIFDAVDECDQSGQRKDLLPLFKLMEENGISLFLTSRPHPEDVRCSLQNVAKVELSAQAEDIAKYVEQKINENPRASRLVSEGGLLKDKIISELVYCAKGMFLLVHFQIKYICQQTTVTQVLNELERCRSFSTGNSPLWPTYDRAMATVRQQHKTCIELALKIFLWLIKAKRTLTVDELREAVSVKPGEYQLVESDLPDRTTLLDVCAGLVTVDEKSSNIRLAHYTVQEYLLENCIIPELEDGDSELAMTCTTYLTFSVFSKAATCNSSLLDRFQSHPFLGYAAQQLSPHLRACSDSISGNDNISSAVLRFFSSLGNVCSYSQALGLWDHTHLFKDNPDMFGWCQHAQLPLYVAIDLGQHVAVRFLLDQGAGISVEDQDGWGEALQRAVSGGNLNIIQILLDKGAKCAGSRLVPIPVPCKLIRTEPNPRRRWTAVHQAARYGHRDVVRLLLSDGADLAVLDSMGRTPLHEAAYQGHQAVVGFLIENGVDLSIRDGKGVTALHLAASEGHELVVQLLFDNQTIYSQDHFGRTALYRAAERGHGRIVDWLLKQKANPSIPNIFGETAMHSAASKGFDNIINLLLNYEADPATQDVFGCTALDRARYQRRESTIQLLCKDPNLLLRDISELELAEARRQQAVMWVESAVPKDFVGKTWGELCPIIESATQVTERQKKRSRSDKDLETISGHETNSKRTRAE